MTGGYEVFRNDREADAVLQRVPERVRRAFKEDKYSRMLRDADGSYRLYYVCGGVGSTYVVAVAGGGVTP